MDMPTRPSSTAHGIDPLKAERIQLAPPLQDLELELATPTDAAKLIDWLTGSACVPCTSADSPTAEILAAGTTIRVSGRSA